MSFRRIVLAALTLVVVVLAVGPALLGSLEEQQIASRLELYQTDLMLQAQAFSPGDSSLAPVRQSLVGNTPLDGALDQYQSLRDDTASELSEAQTELSDLNTTETSFSELEAAQALQLEQNILAQKLFLNRLDLRLGILQAEAGDLGAARDRWQAVDAPTQGQTVQGQTTQGQTTQGKALAAPTGQAEAAQVLMGLWSDPPKILPDAEPTLQRSLQGWFQTRSLAQLYRVQQRSDALGQLETAEQGLARQSLIKLTLLGIGPVLGGLIGVGLLIFLGIQRITKGERALLAEGKQLRWTTPWDWEITWQVLVVGFFLVGQIILPLALAVARETVLRPLLGSSLTAPGGRIAAGATLVTYLLLALASLSVLYLSIRRYRPLPEGWFNFNIGGNWPLWGLGGYFAAVPLVIGVSLVNQQIWQGRGGSNPLLQIVLDETDPVALGLFFFTAAVAAPVFEEFLFRGFLLPSLTRYMSVWPAIALSAFIFAAAHLSVSEILPLMVLGIVLGFVYTRSRNLLAPMLLHSLWNSATLLGLFVLGSVE